MKKAIYFLTLFLVMNLMTAPTVFGGSSKRGGQIKIGFDGDIRTVDPHGVHTDVEVQVATFISEQLVDINRDLHPMPGLANSWESSKDLKTWTFHLRQGVKFHNGREMTAEDVKFTFDRVMDPKSRSKLAASVRRVKKVEAIDRYTLQLTLDQPAGTLISGIITSALYVIAPECVNGDGSVTKPIGTGPFKLEDWKPNDHIQLSRFNNYWKKGLPYLDAVKIVPIPDKTVRLAALRAGDVDLAHFLIANDAMKVEKSGKSNLTFAFDNLGAVLFLGMNNSKPPFNNMKVRQAIAYTIDREQYNLGITEGTGSVTNQVFPESSRWYCDVKKINRDISKAKNLLKEAGYGRGLDVTLNTPANPVMQAIAEIAQMQLSQAGIKLKIQVFDWPTFFGKYFQGEFEMIAFGWTSLMDPDTIYPNFFAKNGTSRDITGYGYQNDQLDKILWDAGQSMNFNRRKAHYSKALQIIVDEAPTLFLFNENVPVGWGERVKGFYPTLTGWLNYADGGISHAWID